jgi:hypothetical protein
MGVVGRANGLAGWIGCIEIPLLYDGRCLLGGQICDVHGLCGVQLGGAGRLGSSTGDLARS